MASRIAFGSCNSQNLSQPLWDVIASRQPSAFIWGGDSIYAVDHADYNRLKSFYQIQNAHPDYHNFRTNHPNITIFGTIDDHDFGKNNGDKTTPSASFAGHAFVKFLLQEDSNSLFYQRAESGLGVYGVRLFDFDRPYGQQLVSDEDAAIDADLEPSSSSSLELKYSNKSVAIFVLDVRTNKTPWRKRQEEEERSNEPDYDGDFLGETQWRWFEKSMERSHAMVNVVVQGLQVHPKRITHPNTIEEWASFPTARRRLYKVLLGSASRRQVRRNFNDDDDDNDGGIAPAVPILVSGDIHLAQLLRKDCYYLNDNEEETTTTSLDASSMNQKQKKHKHRRRRSLIEMTTSGMSHSAGTCFSPVKEDHTTWYAPYTSLISFIAGTWANVFCPHYDILVAPPPPPTTTTTAPQLFVHGGGEGAQIGKQYAMDLNFGEMEFDWMNQTLTVRILGKTMNGTPPLLSAKWSFDQLSGQTEMPNHHHHYDDDFDENWHEDNNSLFLEQVKDENDMDVMCIPHRGKSNFFQESICIPTMIGMIICLAILPTILLLFVTTKLIYKMMMMMRSNKKQNQIKDKIS